ncbi:MAG: hypothetical protein ACLSG8_09450 [Barnesiella sp.]
MEILTMLAIISLLLSLMSAIKIWLDLKEHTQPMKIMNVWPLTALWSVWQAYGLIIHWQDILCFNENG